MNLQEQSVKDGVDYGIRLLLSAVVMRACEDYFLGLKYHKPDPYKYGIRNDLSPHDYIARNMQDAYIFITSDYFSGFTAISPNTILKQLHIMAETTDKFPSTNLI